MSLARQLGFRVEKGTLLERLPPELKEELYLRVYHWGALIHHKPRSFGRYGLAIGKDEICITADTVNLSCLEKFIRDIFRGSSSSYQSMVAPYPAMNYDSPTDSVTVTGMWVDDRGWIHIRPKTFTFPMCVSFVQALCDLRKDVYMR